MCLPGNTNTAHDMKEVARIFSKVLSGFLPSLSDCVLNVSGEV